MESGVIDLNKTRRKKEGCFSGSLDYVLLQKDCKNICRAKVYDLPIEVPFVWPIMKFEHTKVCQQSDFPKFSLVPAPEDGRQNSEWDRFMRYLGESKKAGIVTFGSSTFHILAPQPDEHNIFTHAVLIYEREQNGLGDCKQMAGQSVRQVNSPVSESSPFESVENRPRVLDSMGKKRTTNPMKNFFVSNPSFLRTLGEAHDCWIFGALAELIDNSRDAGASRLNISIESMFLKKEDTYVPVLCVIDDGLGMTYSDMMRMISFGNKGLNKHCSDKIGRCGVGFKTGAMKLGKDVVLTQTSSSRSVAFLSQSFNEEKCNVEIPVVTYRKEGQHMELDLSIQSEATAKYHLNAIKNFSPFTKYYLGEKIGLFGEKGTGTQIYIWNLDKWGTDYTLEWHSGKSSENPVHKGRTGGDILIRSRRVRSRQGQLSNKVKSRRLAKTLNNTSIMSGEIMGKTVVLTLGMSKIEFERMNCGIFLYWHGRLIEPYKRVGGQKHSADTGRGLIGVADITDLIDEEDGHSWVLNNKQGFKDCEIYAKLEEWLGRKVDEYWDAKYDNLEVREWGEDYKNKDEWVQCYSCRKWRVLNAGFNPETLPEECCVSFHHGTFSKGENAISRLNKVYRQVLLHATLQWEIRDLVMKSKIGSEDTEVERTAKKEPRSEDTEVERTIQDEEHVKATPATVNKGKGSSNDTLLVHTISSDDDDLGGASSQTEDNVSRPKLKRLRRGPPKSYNA
ncbi:unnamed protein product [Urochloa decumbens]|uniref:Morc S5 domain-containing protein n=1 Tax=Urochloa decumbens TaxID=240449 RepID=A0ABC9DZJ6_9POAL